MEIHREGARAGPIGAHIAGRHTSDGAASPRPARKASEAAPTSWRLSPLYNPTRAGRYVRDHLRGALDFGIALRCAVRKMCQKHRNSYVPATDVANYMNCYDLAKDVAKDVPK